MPSKTKALDPETNERLRALTRRLMEERYEGKVTVAARALGVTHPALVEFLAGSRGAGMKLLEGLQRVTGLSLDALVHDRREAEPSQLAPPASGLLRHPDYPPLRERLQRHFSADVVEMVDRADFGQPREFLSWSFVLALAEAAQKYVIEKADRDRNEGG